MTRTNKYLDIDIHHMKNEKKLVSVVITTKNEEKNIGNCLESLKEQTYKNIEIIVVDNHSDDKTKDIARNYTKQIFDKGPERSAQRNYGMIDKSQGKYVMFLDADMILSPDLVENCVETIEKNKKAVALHIPEIILGKNYFSRVRRFERTFYDGTPIDGVRFFDREIFIKTGGFDGTLCGPEDWDIDRKVREYGKVVLVNKPTDYKNWSQEKFIKDKGVDPRDYKSVIFHNESEFDLKKYLEKKGYYSKSFDKYIEKWGKNDPEIKKQLGFYYRFFGVFVENGKWEKLLSHLDLTFGMYYLRFLVGIKYITRKKK